jgi:hypothetical protein
MCSRCRCRVSTPRRARTFPTDQQIQNTTSPRPCTLHPPSSAHLTPPTPPLQMSLLQELSSRITTVLLSLAAAASRFEASTLHIPHPLRFFTEGATPAEHFQRAFLFAVAPYSAFVAQPLLDAVLNRGRRAQTWRQLCLRCGGWYFQFLLTFWAVILIVRALHCTEKGTKLIWW